MEENRNRCIRCRADPASDPDHVWGSAAFVESYCRNHDASAGRSGASARHALAGGDAARTLSALQRPERYPDNKGEAVEDLVGNSGRPREPADVSRWARSGSDDERPESFSYASP